MMVEYMNSTAWIVEQVAIDKRNLRYIPGLL